MMVHSFEIQVGADVSERSIENPSVPLTDYDKFMDAFGEWAGGPTASGVSVSHQGSLRYSPVWSCVDQISGDIAKLPLDLFIRTDGGREVDQRHAATRLVRRQANMRQAAYQFWREIIVDACLYPGGFAWIEQENGRPVGLYPLLPDRTHYDTEHDIYVTEVAGQRVGRLPEEILHIRGLSLSSGTCDPVAYFRESIALGMAAMDVSGRFFKNGQKAGGVLVIPPGMSKPAADRLEEGFRKTHEAKDAWFKSVILRDGAEWRQTMVNARDSQMVELREEQVRDVARFFKMPPSRLGVKDSVSYNSREQDNQFYLDTTLSHWLEAIVAECWLKLLTKTEQLADRHYFEHNTGALLRLDGKSRAEMYHFGITDGWLTRADVREMENWPAIDGLDKPLFPANMTVVGEPAPQPPPAPRSDNNLRRVVYQIGARARHKAESPEAFVTWLDGGLTWHRDHYRKLIGGAGEDAFFGPILERLNSVAQTATKQNLADAVDVAMTQLENET